MLLITHDLGIVRQMADDVCVMQRGKIVEAGATEEMFSNPAASLHQAAARRRAQGQAAAEPIASAPGGRQGRQTQSLVSDQARLLPHAPSAISRRSTASTSRCAPGRRSASSANPARARPRLASRCCGSSGRKGRSSIVGQRHRRLQREGDAAAAQGDADRLPGSVRLAVAAPVGPADRRGGADRPGQGHERARSAATRVATALDRGRARSRNRWTAIRMNFPAASASASPSPAPWRSSRRFIVLDEPTSALDMSIQAQIVDLLRELQQRAQSRLSVHQPRSAGWCGRSPTRSS